jgi:phosphatidylserine/phosphatidylglycerophosphate/cardiolipin synthase-like enzyme/membrane-associated phospholipid phosphatase
VALTLAIQGHVAVVQVIDDHLHGWVVANRSSWSVSLARVLTWGGSTSFVLPALFAVGVIVLGRGRRARDRLGSGLLLAGLGGVGVYVGLVINNWVGRPRARIEDWAGVAGGPSYPSGHTTAATLFALLCAWAVTSRVAPGRARVILWSAAVVFALAVGWTRVWLGVHWPSDVTGGLLYGAAWSATCLAVVSWRRSHRSLSGVRSQGAGLVPDDGSHHHVPSRVATNHREVITERSPRDAPACRTARVAPVDLAEWFLAAAERGNPDTRLLARHPESQHWATGNDVRPLVHGAVYFRELLGSVRAMGAGDLLLFTDWRGDADERLDGPGSEVGQLFAAAAARGVDVRGLVWRSHFDGFSYSASENRHLGAEIEAAGGQCLLDMRVRVLGSHHQKLVVLRHPDRPEADVAFLGGIDLCHGRRDDAEHAGDPQGEPLATVYGRRPPWHDIQVAVRGPAVGDAEVVFRERWDDRAALSRNPVHLVGELLHREQRRARPLPEQGPDPAPCGDVAVQLLRTYPVRRPGYPFARRGERSVARGYTKALSHARSLVYVEDQYLWSTSVAGVFADALSREPELRMVFVIPLFPDQDGRISMSPNLIGRAPALEMLRAAGGDRVAVYGLENSEGAPIYVHAKACVVDDTWACIGSDNANRRSWTHDSELSAGFADSSSTGVARSLRLELAYEHLGGAASDYDLDDATQWFTAFRETARALDDWYLGGGAGPRPPGQLRRYTQPAQPWSTRLWAGALYRRVYDPDGRRLAMRLSRRY